MAFPDRIDPENLRRRRTQIPSLPAPSTRHDYIIDHEYRASGTVVSAGEASINILLRYVPDRRLLDPAAGLSAYFAELQNQPAHTLADLALTVLEDLNDEVIPKWLQVTAAIPSQATKVIIEDQQPGWNNQRLIARLSPV